VVYEGATTTAKSWLYKDHLGSVIGTADATGTSTAIYSYGPYGEPNTTSGQRFRYTGQQLIGGLGLYYYKARFYSPTLGRFLQTDPIGTADDLNLYAYVGGNPMNATDPSGLYAASSSSSFSSGGSCGAGGGDLRSKLSDSSSVQVAQLTIRVPLPPVGGVPGNGGNGGYNSVTDTMNPYTPDIATQLYNRMFNSGSDNAADKPAEPSPDSTSAADKAKELGYDRKVKDPPFNSHGQPVFTNGKDFITPDADQHNGGEWKGFDRRGRRTGTYDENLDRIGK
jgi:RHS repeat-associated protein